MRLIRHCAAGWRPLLVSVLVLAPTIGLTTGCSGVRKAIDNANASAAATLVLSKLTARFGRQDLIVQMAIYPGEVEAVIAGNNGQARAVTATYTGALTVGSLAAFDGPATASTSPSSSRE